MEQKQLRERVDQLFKENAEDTSRYLKELKHLLSEAGKIGDIYSIGKLNMMLSLCWFDLGNREYILPPAVKAVDIFEKLNDRNMIGLSRNLLGLAYRAKENYVFAIDNYNRAIDAIRGIKNPIGIGMDVIRNNIAECYYLMGKYKKSIRLLEESLAVLRATRPDDHMNAVVYGINLSDNYESLNQFDKAIEILDLIRPDVEIMARNVLLWGYYARRCCALYKNGRLEEAEHYADLTIESVNSGYDSYEFHRDFEKIAELEVQIGDFRRAQCFADILTAYAEANKHTIDLIFSKRVQASICDARGETQNAIVLYRELNALYKKRMQEQREMQYENQRGALAASREIGKLLQRIRVSEEKAERDPLTGLMNRSALVSVTNEFIQKAKEKGRMLGSIFLDIDFFKEYNDTYGHAAGDEVIKFIAKVCLGVETSTIKFFRYGGDEYFGIVLGHKDEDLEKIALRIAETVRLSGFEHKNRPNGNHLTVSIGVVNINMKNSDNTILDIIKYADKALYQAKNYGKNVVFAARVLPNGERDYVRVTAK